MVRYIEIDDKEQLKVLRYKGLTEAEYLEIVKLKKLRIAFYGRYSSDMQREESIDAQLRYCKEEIRNTPEYALVAVYYDEAKSGKFDKRDDFQRMMEDAKDGKFDIIIVHKFSRFARNKYDSVLYKKKLRELGIRVISATQKIDDTPEGQMTESIIEALDEYYSANLAGEVIKGMRENALKGKSTGGPAPLGYKHGADGKLEIDDEKAPIVRKIFDMCFHGHGYFSIANTLNERGLRTMYGKPFGSRSIGVILSNEKYIGTYTYEISKEEIITIKNNHPPIIDLMTWEAVQRIRKERTKPRLHKSKVIYPLTGKMYCAECNETYSGAGGKYSGSKGQFYNYYNCRNVRYKTCTNKAVNKEKLEKYLCDHILNVILSEESIEAIATKFEAVIEQIIAEQKTVTGSVDDLLKEKADLESMIAKLLDLYLDPSVDLSKDEYKRRTEENKRQLKAVERQIQAMQINKDDIITKKEALRYLQDFKDTFDSTNRTIVKALLDTFIDKIIVYKDRFDVTYKIDIHKGFKMRQTASGHFLDTDGGNGNNALPNFTIPPLYINRSFHRYEVLKTEVEADKWAQEKD